MTPFDGPDIYTGRITWAQEHHHAVRAMAPTFSISEKDWQANVAELAAWLGWLRYHTYDSRRSEAGFPDLVLVRERVIFAELKRQSGKLTPAQTHWVERLTEAGAEVHVWRPSDWPTVVTTLDRPSRGTL